DARERVFERAREALRAFLVALEEVIRHALRRFRPDAGQATQRLDQLLERDRLLHQNGRPIPGGRLSPAVKPAIFPCLTASAFATASFIAAITRSSSMSLSSDMRLGSITTFFTANLQVIVTFTRPAPDWPSISVFASSSCALRMFSCICCACFIKAPSPPFIMSSPLVRRCAGGVSRGLDRGSHPLRAEIAHELAHEGIVLDRFRRARLALRGLARARRRDAVAVGRADPHVQPESGSEMRRELRLELVD